MAQHSFTQHMERQTHYLDVSIRKESIIRVYSLIYLDLLYKKFVDITDSITIIFPLSVAPNGGSCQFLANNVVCAIMNTLLGMALLIHARITVKD